MKTRILFMPLFCLFVLNVCLRSSFAQENPTGLSNTSQNLQLIQQLHEAPNYVTRIFDYINEETEWWEQGPSDVFQWTGKTFRGTDGIRVLFSDFSDVFEIDIFKPREYIAQGDQVVVILWFVVWAKATGKRAESEIIRIYTFRDSKIVRVRTYYDSFAFVSAVRND